MTVLEMFYNCRVRSPLKVMSGYNSKVLCQNFIPDKHLEIGKREVIAIWADIAVTKATFGNYAQPILCAFVDGSDEYEKEQRKKKESENDG